MPTYVIYEVTRDNMQPVGNRAAWQNDIQINGQFRWCANGGEDGRTLCIALLDEQSNLYVGFLGLILAIEDLESDVNAFVSVEFVYLHEQVRGRGLSSHFLEYAMKKVVEWLYANEGALTGRVVTLNSASNPKSDEGQHFVARLEERLRPEATARRWTFTSGIDDEGRL